MQQRAKRASEKISVICTSYYLHYWHSFGAKNIFGTLQRQKMPALILQGQIPFVTLQRRDFSPAALILQGKFPFMTLQRQQNPEAISKEEIGAAGENFVVLEPVCDDF